VSVHNLQDSVVKPHFVDSRGCCAEQIRVDSFKLLLLAVKVGQQFRLVFKPVEAVIKQPVKSDLVKLKRAHFVVIIQNLQQIVSPVNGTVGNWMPRDTNRLHVFSQLGFFLGLKFLLYVVPKAVI